MQSSRSPLSLFRTRPDAKAKDDDAAAGSPADSPTLARRPSRLSSFLSPLNRKSSRSASPSQALKQPPVNATDHHHHQHNTPRGSASTADRGPQDANAPDMPIDGEGHALAAQRRHTGLGDDGNGNDDSHHNGNYKLSNAADVDEHEVARHLADFESSFLPSPLATTRYVAGAPEISSSQNIPHRSRDHAIHSPRPDPAEGAQNIIRRLEDWQGSDPDPHTSNTQRPTFRSVSDTIAEEEDGEVEGDDSLYDLTTTPRKRGPSAWSASASHPSESTKTPQSTGQQSRDQGTSSPSPAAASDDRSRTTSSHLEVPAASTAADLPQPSIEEADDVSGTSPATAALDSIPSYVRSHQASQRSSSSSFITQNSGLETPASRSTLRPELNRVPSLGSVASSMSDFADSASTRRRKRPVSGGLSNEARHLSRLSEEPRSSPAVLRTPATGTALQDPTNTVLAQHVRDVQVPATVAREYRASHKSANEDQSALSTPAFVRTKGDLTLKEQNSKIDKLSKENFDLKLKIHYLYQALQDRSDEGVKDLVGKNAQLSADLVRSKKEARTLKKRIRELEELARQREGAPSLSHGPDESETDGSSQVFKAAQMEDELQYLRSRIQALEERNGDLQREGVSREVEKRRLADHVRSLQSPGAARDGQTSAAEEALNELLDVERARREEAEQRAQVLYAELQRLRSDQSPTPGHGHPAAESRFQDGAESLRHGSSLSGSTLIEHLRQENTELRRDLSAQTSMLTSRNRERERLQQEIEDLKLVQRRNLDPPRSLAGDSILDRSISRNNFRPTSRQSAATRLSQLSDQEKDHYEDVQAVLRDENSSLKLRNQDLQRELDQLAFGSENLQRLRQERDHFMNLMEADAEWAKIEIGNRDREIERCREEIENLLADLDSQDSETSMLQKEISAIRESLNRVADDSEDSRGTIHNLREELITTTGEIEALEKNLRDANAANERLEVQAESSQTEIAFLREEQESDKIKIGDLQAALRSAKSSLRDEKERLREVDELEADARRAREEARKLRKQLSAREEETLSHKEGLDELEGKLRDVFGIQDGSRSALVRSVVKMQQTLADTIKELDQTRSDLDERDRVLNDRNGLLDSSGAETRRLLELLERERQGRKHDQAMHDKAMRASGGSANSANVAALEQSYKQQLHQRNIILYNLWCRLATICGSKWLQKSGLDKHGPSLDAVSRDSAAVDQPMERALRHLEHMNKEVGSRIRETERELLRRVHAMDDALQSRTKRLDRLEKAASLTGNLDAAGSEEIRAIKNENRSLRKELNILKQGAFALPGLPSPQEDLDRAAAAAAAEERRRALELGYGFAGIDNEHARSRQPSALSRRVILTEDEVDRASAAGSQTSPRRDDFSRQSSRSAADALGANGDGGPQSEQPGNLAPSEQRWILRLKELEKRLTQEREARLLDRKGARRRLEEGQAENEGLKKALEREKMRNGAGSSASRNHDGQHDGEADMRGGVAE